MSIQEKVRNIVFYFVKNEYKNYLEQHELKFIPEEDLDKVVDIFYIQKEKTLKECELMMSYRGLEERKEQSLF